MCDLSSFSNKATSNMATGGLNLSSEFFQLLKAIGESKSKQEEDRIIAKEVARLKQKMESPPANQTGAQAAFTNPKKLAKEFLVRLLYVSMLGHDNSWGLIRVSLSQSSVICCPTIIISVEIVLNCSLIRIVVRR